MPPLPVLPAVSAERLRNGALAPTGGRHSGLRATAMLLLLVTLCGLAAWQIPPRLDWARYRGSIATFAASRLGRGVSIGGQIHLSLLPHVVLSAADVALADRGDGISAHFGALRLQVAFLPLLARHVVPLSLTLDDPAVSLPWPLPAGVPAPALAPGFAAQTEGGSLRIGGLVLNAVTADVRVDPDTGAFGAQGATSLYGVPCRFTSLIGAVGPDGIAAVTLTLDALGKSQGNGASFHGRMLQGGSLQGGFSARGPDLGAWMAAPDRPWSLRGEVTATKDLVSAPKLKAELANSPGSVAATLRLLPYARLDVSAAIGGIDLGAWTKRVPAASAGMPLHIEANAGAARWLGASLLDPRMTLSHDAGTTTITADAKLPGNALLHFTARHADFDADGRLAGSATLSAADLPATLDWLKPVLPTSAAAVIDHAPATADARTNFAVDHSGTELSDIAVKLGPTIVTGAAGWRQGARPSIHATLAANKVVGPGWPASDWKPVLLLLREVESDIDLSVTSLTLADLPLAHVALQMHAGGGGIIVRHAASDLPGLHAEASGTIGVDGALVDSHIDLTAPDAAALPAAWRQPAGLWHGPLHVAVSAAGSPRRISASLRADLADARAEAEAEIDATAPHLAATVTIRHPGAPRFFGLLGWPDAQRSIDDGSLAFQAHITADPLHLGVQDFSVTAASMRAAGSLNVDLSGPFITGEIDAPSLALPRFDARAHGRLPLAWLANWQGQLRLHADAVNWGVHQIAIETTADIAAASGALAVDVAKARVAGGDFTGQFAYDATGETPALAIRASLAGASIDALPQLPGLRLTGGSITLSGELTGAGNSPAALLATAGGTLHASVQAANLQDIDLARVQRLLAGSDARLRTSLQEALDSGETGPLAGTGDATVIEGALQCQSAHLTGASGSIGVSGIIDLPASQSALLLRIVPAMAYAPPLSVRIAGPWQDMRRSLDIKAALSPASGPDGGKKR